VRDIWDSELAMNETITGREPSHLCKPSVSVQPPPSCCPNFSLSISFGVAWSLSMSIASYAQGLWLCGSVGLAVCSCSVLVPVWLPCVLPIYLPGSGSLVPLVGGVVEWC
jgi:hypothetical protein